jgi:hypothetical protein
MATGLSLPIKLITVFFISSMDLNSPMALKETSDSGLVILPMGTLAPLAPSF